MALAEGMVAVRGEQVRNARWLRCATQMELPVLEGRAEQAEELLRIVQQDQTDAQALLEAVRGRLAVAEVFGISLNRDV